MKQVIIFGAGDIAEIAHFYLTHDSDCEVAAFTVDRDFIMEDNLHGLPVVPFDEIEEKNTGVMSFRRYTTAPPDPIQAFAVRCPLRKSRSEIMCGKFAVR